MALLNQKAFERKLQNMSSTQDSVQTVSLWMIHHKKHAMDMGKIWLDQLKKVKIDRRLVLFYLANDVLQNSRKKGKELCHAFNKVLREGMHLLSDSSIRGNVERVLKIWEDRKVFEKDYLENLRSRLGSTSSKEKIPQKQVADEVEIKPKIEKRLPPADFKPSKLIDTLSALREFEAEMTLKQSHLTSLRIDASDLDAVHQLKDRAGGAKFWQEHEEATAKLEEFCDTLRSEQMRRKNVIRVLEDGDAFYATAFGEVKVIVHAYKTFGNRLSSLKKKLDHKVNKLVVKAAERAKTGCVSAPLESFLTSGLPDMSVGTPSSTPPQAKEGQISETSSENKPADPTIDNIEVADMDIEEDSDSEKPSNSEEQSSKLSQEELPVSATSTSAASASPSTTALAPAPVVPPGFVGPPMIPPQPGVVATRMSLPVSPYIGVSPFPVLSQAFVPIMPGMAPLIPNMHLQVPGQGGVLAGQAIPSGLLPRQGHPLTPPPQLPPSLSLPISSTPTSIVVQGIQNSNVSTMGTASALETCTITTQTIAGSIVSSTDKVTASKLYSPTQCGSSSPQSIDSAPSPVGSPELNLDDGDDTPETTPAPMGDVSFSFPGSKSFMDIVQMVPRSVPSSGASPADPGTSSDDTPGPSSSGTPSNPDQSKEDSQSKQISAVDILAQLLSKGRQLKKQSDDSPSEEAAPLKVETPQKEVPQGRPLISLIDSLFPKLSDSIKILKEKEQQQTSHSPTSRSPSQCQSEVPRLSGNPMQESGTELSGIPPPEAEEPRFWGQRPLTQEGPTHGAPFRGGPLGPEYNAPVHEMWRDGPPDHHRLPGPQNNRPPNMQFSGPPREGPFAPEEGIFHDERRAPFTGPRNNRPLDFPQERPPNRQFSGLPHDGPFPQGPPAPEEGRFHDESGTLFQGPPRNGPTDMGLVSPPRNGPSFGQMGPFVEPPRKRYLSPGRFQEGPHEEVPFERSSGFPRGHPREVAPFGRAPSEGGPSRAPGGMQDPLGKTQEPEGPPNPPHSNHNRFHPNNTESPDTCRGPGEGPALDTQLPVSVRPGGPGNPTFTNLSREGPHGPPGNRRHSDDRGAPRGPDFGPSQTRPHDEMHHVSPMNRGSFPGAPGGPQFQANFNQGDSLRRNSQRGQEQWEPPRDTAGAPPWSTDAHGPSGKIDYCDDDPSFWSSFEPSAKTSQIAVHLPSRADRTFPPDRNFEQSLPEHQRHPFVGFKNYNVHSHERPVKRPLPPPPFPPGLPPKRPFC